MGIPEKIDLRGGKVTVGEVNTDGEIRGEFEIEVDGARYKIEPAFDWDEDIPVIQVSKWNEGKAEVGIPEALTPKQRAFLKSFQPVHVYDTVEPQTWSAPFIAWFLGWDKMEESWPHGEPTAAFVNEAIAYLKGLVKEPLDKKPG